MAKKKSYFQKQLMIGTKVEMEHTTNKHYAEQIARTHLKENKDYYKYYKQNKGKEFLVSSKEAEMFEEDIGRKN